MASKDVPHRHYLPVAPVASFVVLSRNRYVTYMCALGAFVVFEKALCYESFVGRSQVQAIHFGKKKNSRADNEALSRSARHDITPIEISSLSLSVSNRAVDHRDGGTRDIGEISARLLQVPKCFQSCKKKKAKKTSDDANGKNHSPTRERE